MNTTYSQSNIPAITVLMAAHNAEKYLGESIESILNQTYADFEFLIFDDASTDNTSSILKKYADGDTRIRVIRNKTNIGLTKSLNQGLREARGMYIARMDADDIALPDRLELQKKYLEEHQNITCVGGATIIIDANSKQTGTKQPPTDLELLKFHMMLKNQMSHPTVMFRTADILSIGGYDESFRYAQDYDLWSRLLSTGKMIGNISQPVLKYRFHASSITQGANAGASFEYAMNIARRNLSVYLHDISTTADSEQAVTVFLQSLHRQKVSSLKDLRLVRSFISKFTKNYLASEHPSKAIESHIRNYLNTQKRLALQWYIKGLLGSKK